MHSRPYPCPSRPTPRQTQSGVVLIVVLIMLVVIGLVSATAMRGALTADQISNNARLESLAKQAAQIALRFCETAVTEKTITIQAAAATEAKQAWRTYSNWGGTKPIATTLTKDYMKSTDSAFTPSSLPQCMAEVSPDSAALTIVTARGFGPDYVAKSNAGAVVWLQSVIAMSSVSSPSP
jgi:type IV pilus assembly protein PilX